MFVLVTLCLPQLVLQVSSSHSELVSCNVQGSTQKHKRGISILHSSSARSFRPSSNLFTTGLDIQSESRKLDRIWCRLYLCHVYSALHPNFNNQFHCCRKPMPSQAPESAAINSASPLLSAIVDCFLLDAVIGYQPSLPRNHDAVPLTLNRSASPAHSLSLHTSTLSSEELFSQLPDSVSSAALS